MIEQLAQASWSSIAILLLNSLFAGLYLVFGKVRKHREPIFDAPKLYEERGAKDLAKLHSIVKTEFQKYRGTFFKLGEAHGECVILPTEFMEELKALPDHMLNLDDEIDEVNSPNARGGYRSDALLMKHRDFFRSTA
ncbi:MAG: hypothetical protein Q9191_003874 [Dirinaria sp. TL-2023a]